MVTEKNKREGSFIWIKLEEEKNNIYVVAECHKHW